MIENKVYLGIFWLLLIPVIVGVFAFLFMFLLPFVGVELLPQIAVIIIMIYSIGIYVVFITQDVSYSDSKVLEDIVLPNAPKKICDMLMTQTRGTNILVNVEIISSLGMKSLIQTELVERVQNRGVKLSHTRINKYLSNLEKLEIIKSTRDMSNYKKEFSITEKGVWCLKAIKICFPKRFFWFIIRHYLGHIRLPPFPEKDNEMKM